MATRMKYSVMDTLFIAKTISVNAWINADKMFLQQQNKNIMPAKVKKPVSFPIIKTQFFN